MANQAPTREWLDGWVLFRSYCRDPRSRRPLLHSTGVHSWFQIASIICSVAAGSRDSVWPRPAALDSSIRTRTALALLALLALLLLRPVYLPVCLSECGGGKGRVGGQAWRPSWRGEGEGAHRKQSSTGSAKAQRSQRRQGW
ncbi:hypothetical protein BS50DRAFT_411025 [Corynespora cassiicola Philippines]|uniref:Uncharacterized protein n=1 Tax=Corynespora cassiicola Philippines TaxID=1448308 RepID=A0A2T2NLH1_CORCC|nr:hypothetical protein BS50DRAFT_411025 [Corynespora cassiicola Philippines]